MSNLRKVYDQELYAHFITFSCYKRRQLLTLETPKRIVLGTLNNSLHVQQAKCIGFVIMPNHVHAIVWFLEPGQLSSFMQTWKRRSSEQISKWYQQENIEYFKTIDGDPLWQPKYHSFEIYSDSKLEEKLNYMHENPVRARLVGRAIDWRWSSARHYIEGRSVGVSIEWVF